MEAVFLIWLWGIWGKLVSTILIVTITLGAAIGVAFLVSNRGFFGNIDDAKNQGIFEGEYLFAYRCRKYLAKPFLAFLFLFTFLPQRDVLTAMIAAPTVIETAKGISESNATKKLMVMPEKLIDLMNKTIDEKLKADQ